MAVAVLLVAALGACTGATPITSGDVTTGTPAPVAARRPASPLVEVLAAYSRANDVALHRASLGDPTWWKTVDAGPVLDLDLEDAVVRRLDGRSSPYHPFAFELVQQLGGKTAGAYPHWLIGRVRAVPLPARPVSAPAPSGSPSGSPTTRKDPAGVPFDGTDLVVMEQAGVGAAWRLHQSLGFPLVDGLTPTGAGPTRELQSEGTGVALQVVDYLGTGTTPAGVDLGRLPKDRAKLMAEFAGSTRVVDTMISCRLAQEPDRGVSASIRSVPVSGGTLSVAAVDCDRTLVFDSGGFATDARMEARYGHQEGTLLGIRHTGSAVILTSTDSTHVRLLNWHSSDVLADEVAATVGKLP